MQEQCPRRLRAECDRKAQDCGLIKHHIFYPRRKYEEAGTIPASFRELGVNIVQMCKKQETDLHNTQPDGPPMPSLEFMSYLVEHEKLKRGLAP